ncbi:ester cyclase [Fulvivirga sp. M361]|uniref:ester cyclase n=1 Tax=Fulvivirga sp. M361 TaxID=2594266 RepID=UPI00117B30A3|nr:ester cyclase [Fulvivirga sp. M361]TRX60763.1 ester cyclase [Fulvivirga sp. M361]
MHKEAFLREFMTEIWNNKRLDKIAQYVHKEYTIHLDTSDPWEGKTLSHEEFKERLHYSFNSFPDMYFDITSAITEEEHVAITWVLTGTNHGNIGEFPATRKPIHTKGFTIYHFKDDLISGHTQVFDRSLVMKQLGFS